MSDAFCKSSAEKYRYINRFSAEYPEKLQEIKNPPAGIYVKGRLPDPTKPSVAIVGSRICSQYGRLAAEEFGSVLAKNGVQIISGLARGIDVIGQNAACDSGGSSFGVLGCGINVIYPKQNAEVYKKVEESGGLISEVAPDAPPIGAQFASRNRIISALCDVLLVIEAKERSGSQITVQRALEQGKDVFALPGRIHDVCSAGCNRLIAQGAGIATEPEAILSLFGIYKDTGNSTSDSNKYGREKLEKIEKRVYENIDFYPVSLDEIVSKTRMSIQEVINVLFHLQMKGYVSEVAKNRYVKTKL